mmetsp:Transcript_30338/g.50213  ORF Transcript_30338/g.50213 Transcript_30338/m.50213 type:complete len:212 (-) Transcript_30338:819-1454(-)
MNAKDLVVICVDDHLHQQLLLAVSKVEELGLPATPIAINEHINIRVPLDRNLFRETARAHRRLREYRRSHCLIVNAISLGAIHGMQEGHGLLDRHRGQLHPVSDIADGVDVVLARLRMLVDLNPVACHFHASILQAEFQHIGMSPCRHEYLVTVSYHALRSIFCLHVDSVKAVLLLLHSDGFCFRVHADTVSPLHLSCEEAPAIPVEATQW